MKKLNKEDYFFDHKNKDYSFFPLLYDTDNELKMLEGSIFYSRIKSRQSLIESEFSILKRNKLLNFKDEVLDYIKARLFTMSKKINLFSKTESILSLIPLTDLASFSQDDFNCEYKFNNSSFYLKSVKTILPNESLKIKTNLISNDKSLLYLGYTSDNNLIPNDVYLKLKIKGSNISKITKENNKDNNKDINNNNDTVKEINTTVYESVILNPEYNVSKVLIKFRNIIDSSNPVLPLNINNELLSVKLLKKSLKAVLSRYKTTLKQDVLFLKSNSKNFKINELNALRVVIGEKTVKYKLISFN